MAKGSGLLRLNADCSFGETAAVKTGQRPCEPTQPTEVTELGTGCPVVHTCTSVEIE